MVKKSRGCKCTLQNQGNYCVSDVTAQFKSIYRASGNAGVYDVFNFSITADVVKQWEGNAPSGQYDGVFINVSGENLGPNLQPASIIPLTGISLSPELETPLGNKRKKTYSRDISYVINDVQVDAAIPHQQAYAIDWQVNAGSGEYKTPSWVDYRSPSDRVFIPFCSTYGTLIGVLPVDGENSGIQDTQFPLSSGSTNTNYISLQDHTIVNQSGYPDQSGKFDPINLEPEVRYTKNFVGPQSTWSGSLSDSSGYIPTFTPSSSNTFVRSWGFVGRLATTGVVVEQTGYIVPITGEETFISGLLSEYSVASGSISGTSINSIPMGNTSGDPEPYEFHNFNFSPAVSLVSGVRYGLALSDNNVIIPALPSTESGTFYKRVANFGAVSTTQVGLSGLNPTNEIAQQQIIVASGTDPYTTGNYTPTVAETPASGFLNGGYEAYELVLGDAWDGVGTYSEDDVIIVTSRSTNKEFGQNIFYRELGVTPGQGITVRWTRNGFGSTRATSDGGSAFYPGGLFLRVEAYRAGTADAALQFNSFRYNTDISLYDVPSVLENGTEGITANSAWAGSPTLYNDRVFKSITPI